MRRNPQTGAPDFFRFARDFLHAYMPKTRGLSPKTIEAYRISLECFLSYLAETEHVERDRVNFDHFDRQHRHLRSRRRSGRDAAGPEVGSPVSG